MSQLSFKNGTFSTVEINKLAIDINLTMELYCYVIKRIYVYVIVHL